MTVGTVVLAGFTGLLAVVNFIQVFTGRQLARPSASKRSASQIRRQSAAATVAMVGLTLVMLLMRAAVS
ncbi:hypothetical protein [Peterkaempfera griseoplana]|uniref:hypothetical protein n=1 Tax=Peterkaempfera griseoplana TaxID=66896 RepID=UPI0006E35FED|nr:hypothetical protein [Peterkaempfera griseoplana]